MINLKRNKKLFREVVLGVVLLGFIIYKFSLYNYFGFISTKDARNILRDFEKSYLYSQVFKNSEYQVLKEGALKGKIINKKDINNIIQYVKKTASDPYTDFRYASIFEGKLSYFSLPRLKYDTKIIDQNILLIKFNTFGNDITSKFIKTLDKHEDKKILAIDLRDNSTGDLTEVVGIADFLLEEGLEICKIKKAQSMHNYNSTYGGRNFDKVFVFLNQKSGCLSQIFALALRENLGDKVVLIGNISTNMEVGIESIKYYNKIAMSITAFNWQVYEKSSKDLSEYLKKYEKINLKSSDDYMNLLRQEL